MAKPGKDHSDGPEEEPDGDLLPDPGKPSRGFRRGFSTPALVRFAATLGAGIAALLVAIEAIMRAIGG
jgi:hypothetical protein